MTDWVSEWLTDWLADTLHSRFPLSLFFLSTFSPFFLGTVFCFHFLVYLQRPPPSPSIFFTFYFPFYFRVCSSSSSRHTHTHTHMWKILILLASASASAHSANVSEPVKCLSAEVPDIPEQLAHASAHLPAGPPPPPAYYPIPVLTACKTLWMTLSRFFYIFYRCSIYLLASMLLLLIFYEHCSPLGRFMSPTALGQLPLFSPLPPPLYPSGCCLKAA